jgi:hypothetical protein
MTPWNLDGSSSFEHGLLGVLGLHVWSGQGSCIFCITRMGRTPLSADKDTSSWWAQGSVCPSRELAGEEIPFYSIHGSDLCSKAQRT